ncbi:type I-E CRISPR-associated protein Cas5/CasD [Marinitenerispora sediminis]|uniref:Type I-E CRISPR-associated protein Cas5/CasD n=1 Tax=Marinitenerispora sediminis TaxID=1931232 RepID=A0A368T217_9ACTN|nr:type I-E CRISPR-associated protein Cas5/CasD [Marinitenerispora sediminis]RCV51381.1 type I-E CRISPR-associated protein Cas5/CasD [Marinitenerispora sediminis]RCV55084.1 type I-E CRISPR-associated protein Cas5/CasD [Marinitenerispora sediminis]RCV58106.1 type I-E CRISPR-associated protein Cas5/CasD [Marinitenerispora sediminis]
MSGFLLRLAGPLQSWGEHSAYGLRDTVIFPTRSGLVGMFAAAQGVERGADLSHYDTLGITVRIDRPGTRTVDFHTVGGGMPASRTVPTAEGKRRGAEAGTIVTHRAYLAGAVFTVAVTAPEEVAEPIAAALLAPHWQPYLGRRACVPDQPLVLGRRVADPVAELRKVPLPPPLPGQRDGSAGETVSVEFVYEGDHVPSGRRGERTVLSDVPRSFSGARRAYATRPVTVLPEDLPAALERWRDHSGYLAALYDYVRGRS